MASFVIHHIVGERVLTLLEEYGLILSEEQRIQLLLGNLIPDSVQGTSKEERQQKKISTHFRDASDIELCIQIPNIESFKDKYALTLGNDLSVIGYLLHLYTDIDFFERLLIPSFETLDKNLQPTIYQRETVKIRIKKTGVICDANDFWSENSNYSIYDDYTAMNGKLLEHYHITFVKHRFASQTSHFVNPGIEEVDYKQIKDVLDEMELYIKKNKKNKDRTLNIFEENAIIAFIEVVSRQFIEEYFE